VTSGRGSLERASVVGARLFAAKGYAATTTRELSSALGVTNGTFYHYFATKEELLLRICNESLSRITEAVSAAVAAAPTARERVEALIRSHVETMLADQSLHKTMLTELRSLTGDHLAAVTARRDAYDRLVREVVEDAQAGGAVRSDLDPRTLSLLLLNLLNWTIFWFDPAGALSPAELAETIATLFLDGAAPRT